MKRACENCTSFQPSENKSQTGEVMGECRARSPQVLATYNTPQGGAWQCGWPPVGGTSGWCGEFQPKPVPLRAVEATSV